MRIAGSMRQFQPRPAVQGIVKYFTKQHWNVTEQAKVKRQNLELYRRLKAEAAEFDRTVAQQVAACGQRSAVSQPDRPFH